MNNFKAAIPALIILFALYACVGTLDYRETVKQQEMRAK